MEQSNNHTSQVVTWFPPLSICLSINGVKFQYQLQRHLKESMFHIPDSDAAHRAVPVCGGTHLGGAQEVHLGQRETVMVATL